MISEAPWYAWGISQEKPRLERMPSLSVAEDASYQISLYHQCLLVLSIDISPQPWMSDTTAITLEHMRD